MTDGLIAVLLESVKQAQILVVNMFMSEPSWVFAIEEEKLPDNSIQAVFPKGIPILLIKRKGKIHAISNKCAHMACTLAGGYLDGYTIKCPCHDWKFDIRTGEFLNAKEIKIPTYELRLSEKKVFVKV